MKRLFLIFGVAMALAGCAANNTDTALSLNDVVTKVQIAVAAAEALEPVLEVSGLPPETVTVIEKAIKDIDTASIALQAASSVSGAVTPAQQIAAGIKLIADNIADKPKVPPVVKASILAAKSLLPIVLASLGVK